MSEKETPVRPVRVEYECDKEDCTGTLEATGHVKTSSPPQVEHRCTECGTFQTFLGKRYPRIEHRNAVPERPGDKVDPIEFPTLQEDA